MLEVRKTSRKNGKNATLQYNKLMIDGTAYIYSWGRGEVTKQEWRKRNKSGKEAMNGEPSGEELTGEERGYEIEFSQSQEKAGYTERVHHLLDRSRGRKYLISVAL